MDEPKLKPIRAWEIWNNPILARFARSRLRRRQLLPWGLLVLIANIFIVALLYTISDNTRVPLRELARLGLMLLIVMQGILLMFMGTGATAAGIIQESAEGMVEYQRLTPMSPLAKILGYLLGLPIREYVLACIPLPFIALSAWYGEVAWDALGRFYGVFLVAVLLYHLTGLVAGSVVKKKFVAGRTAQMLVFLLYVVVPRFAHLGFIFLIYLTVFPAWYEQAQPYLPEDAEMTRLIPWLGNQVPWFSWEFGPTMFSFTIQGGLIFVFIVILARKWRDSEAHLMANYFAVLLFGGIALLLLGNAYPLIDSGDFFITSDNFSSVGFAWLTLGIMGVVFLVILMLLTKLITPSHDEARRGFRRATKLQAKRVAPFSDDVTSLWAVVALIVISVCTWVLFTTKLNSSNLLNGMRIAPLWPLAFAASLALPILAYHAVLERWGGRTVLLALLFAWVIPPLAAVILAASGNMTIATYAAGLSGFLMPIYAVVQGNALTEDVQTIRRAFWLSIVLYAIIVPYLIVQLQRYRRQLMRDTGFRTS